MDYDPNDHSIEDIVVLFAEGYNVNGDNLEFNAAFGCYGIESTTRPGVIDPLNSIAAGYVCLSVNGKAIDCDYEGTDVPFGDVTVVPTEYEAISVYTTEVDNSRQSGAVDIDDSLNDCDIQEL